MYRNKEGYPDPTEGAAIRNADRPPKDYRRAVRLMVFAADCMGFEVANRIRLRDKNTGRVWP